ncbi:MAG: transglutaminase [Spirochaetae bacterium HGW-Spirochaetae-1]|jgi:transglutaminase-like putative cysteine protease|nr:MAG: transglutaminase [Spirochaetae bacterium HGW-Spirochaetae-1]
MEDYLKSTYYIESTDPAVTAFAQKSMGTEKDETARAVKLYYAVRDGFKYNPYMMRFEKQYYRASYVLEKGEGFCIQKAILLAAAARSAGIPSRLGFANVINHLSTKNLRDILRTDLFVFHGYTELYINGRWVKATPAFNLSLCEKFGTCPLEFDGIHDSIFHPLDMKGQKHMEYVYDYGSFPDFPLEKMINESKIYYPHLEKFIDGTLDVPEGNFEHEADREPLN